MSRRFTEQEREEFLAGKHIAVLTVAADDGRPPASVPIWYGYEPGGNILINTGGSGRKARLIRQAGKVTVTVQQEELPYKYVVVEGTVTDIVEPAPRADREAIAVRYMGEEAGRRFTDSYDGSGSVILVIRPDRWMSADFTDEL